jgi:hypothetical protein
MSNEQQEISNEKLEIIKTRSCVEINYMISETYILRKLIDFLRRDRCRLSKKLLNLGSIILIDHMK